MPFPAVTALYVGLNALILLYLIFRVISQRTRTGVILGDGEDPEMFRCIRGHANAVETMPMALLILLCVELMGAPAAALHALGAAFTIGRAAHAWHFTTPGASNLTRGLGMLLTLLAIGFGALGLIGHALAGGL